MGISEGNGSQHTAILGIGSYRPSRVIPNVPMPRRVQTVRTNSRCSFLAELSITVPSAATHPSAAK